MTCSIGNLQVPDKTAARIINGTKVTIDGKKVTVNNISNDNEISYIEDGSTELQTRNIKDIEIAVNNKPFLYEQITTLYSDATMLGASANGYETLAVVVLNDPKKMIQIAKDLGELDYHNGDHYNTLMDVIKSIVDPFKNALPKLNVMINRKAKETGGVISGVSEHEANTILLHHSPANIGNMTALEAYAHELTHAATKFAVSSNTAAGRPVLRTLDAIRENFFSTYKASDLEPYMANKSTAKEDAEQLYNYLSTTNASIDEFIAHSVTSRPIIELLKNLKPKEKEKEPYTNAFNYLFRKFKDLLQLIQIKFDKAPRDNEYARMVWVVNQLSMINKTAMRKSSAGAFSRVSQVLGIADSYISNIIKEYEAKEGKKPIQVGAPSNNVFKNYWNISKVIMKSTVDRRYKDVLKLSLSAFGVKPAGAVWSLFKDMLESDAIQDLVERIGLNGNMIDQHRENIHRVAVDEMRTAFGGKLSAKEKAVVTMMIQTDMHSIFNEPDFYEMLSDKQYRQKRIQEIEDNLKADYGSAIGNYYIGQSIGLAKLMRTGKGNSIQLDSVAAIANRANDPTKSAEKNEWKYPKELLKQLDTLVTLHGIKQANPAVVEDMVSLTKEKPTAVVVTGRWLRWIYNRDNAFSLNFTEKEMWDADVNGVFGSENAEDVKGISEYEMPKGYRHATAKPGMEVKYGLPRDETRMKSLGFSKVDTIKLPTGIQGQDELVVYVSSVPLRPRLHKVGLRYTNPRKVTVGITEILYNNSDMRPEEQEELRKAAQKAFSEIALQDAADFIALNNGDFSVMLNKESDIRPKINSHGVQSGYQIQQSEKFLQERLKTEQDPLEIIGATAGIIIDRELSVEFNTSSLIKTVKEEMEKNYIEGKLIGRDNNEYVEISPRSKDKRAIELWERMPGYVRKEFGFTTVDYIDEDGKPAKRQEFKGFAVRADLMNDLLGFMEKGTSHSALVSKLPTRMAQAYRIASVIWKDLIKIEKAGVLLKIPEVLIDNIVSNIVLLVMSGLNPIKVIKYQMDGITALKDYLTKQKEVIQLTAKRESVGLSEEEQNKLNRLNDLLKSSAVKPLIDEGMHSQILEDLQDNDGSAKSDSIITDFFDEKIFTKTPELIRNGNDWLFLTVRNPVTKFMNTATQYSDFVARYAKFHMMMESGNHTKEQAVKVVMDDLVNYNKASSPLIEWANKNGLVMFTKYYTRIQRALIRNFKDKPITTIATLGLIEGMFDNIPTPADSDIFLKSPTSLFHPNLLEHIENFATPGAWKFTSNLLSN